MNDKEIIGHWCEMAKAGITKEGLYSALRLARQDERSRCFQCDEQINEWISQATKKFQAENAGLKEKADSFEVKWSIEYDENSILKARWEKHGEYVRIQLFDQIHDDIAGAYQKVIDNMKDLERDVPKCDKCMIRDAEIGAYCKKCLNLLKHEDRKLYLKIRKDTQELESGGEIPKSGNHMAEKERSVSREPASKDEVYCRENSFKSDGTPKPDSRKGGKA